MISQEAQKEERLHIRTSASQKALLARAAQARHVKVSQFVLQTCLEAAEKIVREQESAKTIQLSTDEYDWLMSKLEEPPHEIPELRRLLNEAPNWNG